MIKASVFALTAPRFRFAIGCALAFAYLAAIVQAHAGGFGSGLAPDTPGYLEFSPYRQPLYGFWANAVFDATSSWATVIWLQVGMFVASVAWMLIELCRASTLGVVAALLLTVLHVVLDKLGLLNLVGSLTTEGLFYTSIVASGALLLVWLRTKSLASLLVLAVVLVGMTQLRTAASLVFLLPLIAGGVTLWTFGWKSKAGRVGAALAATTFVCVVLMPVAVGKRPLQISTPRASLGFAILPRISLLTGPPELVERSSRWKQLSSEWREAAGGLDLVEVAQFDAQLQEAIRYSLAPNILLPDLLGISQSRASNEWTDGTLYNSGQNFALAWIRNDVATYSALSFAHFWGLMTMGNLMGSDQRAHVWAALHAVSPSTWGPGGLRTDYPLNRINEPLKRRTAFLYAAIRAALVATLVLSLFSLARLVLHLWRRQAVARGDIALTAAVAWAVFHSIPAALSVFPELRYTYGNLLALSLGATAWLAYARQDKGEPIAA